MSRARSKISHIIVIVGLSVLVAAGTVPCSAWAKGGDQGNGNGGGNGNGHDNNGNGGGNGSGNGGGNGSGHDNNGNGNGNGDGSGGGHGGTAANGGGASANGASGAAASGGPANVESADEALASNPMLGRAVVALNATVPMQRPATQAGLDTRIQQMAAYDRAMLYALAMPDRTPVQQAARNRAISAARSKLALATNRRLNPEAVRRIDLLLGLPTSDPTLGVE